MRASWPIAAAAALLAATSAAAQSGGGGAGSGSGAASTGAGAAAARTATITAPPARTGPVTPTTHAQVAERLAGRGGANGTSGAAAAPDPRVSAASRAADQAVEEDPTVRDLLAGGMTKPPSLYGGAPAAPAAPAKGP